MFDNPKKNCFLVESKLNIEINIRSRNNCFFFIAEKMKGENTYMKNNCKNGNPKKKSEFICLSCGRIIMDGIQRPRQREKDHIKDLFCVFEGKDVKSIEVRWCDDVNEIRAKIPELKREYGYK